MLKLIFQVFTQNQVLLLFFSMLLSNKTYMSKSVAQNNYMHKMTYNEKLNWEIQSSVNESTSREINIHIQNPQENKRPRRITNPIQNLYKKKKKN